jgi:hypothetical protein
MSAAAVSRRIDYQHRPRSARQHGIATLGSQRREGAAKRYCRLRMQDMAPEETEFWEINPLSANTPTDMPPNPLA